MEEQNGHQGCHVFIYYFRTVVMKVTYLFKMRFGGWLT